MKGRRIIAADIHGRYDIWRGLLELMGPDDGILVAGDLFDNRYGDVSRPSFNPESIREEAIALGERFQYAYGNCDIPDFLPGREYESVFEDSGRWVLLRHGHIATLDPMSYDLVIQGHTHRRRLTLKNGTLLLNPGSPVFPKDGAPSFAVWESDTVRIFDAASGRMLGEAKLPPQSGD